MMQNLWYKNAIVYSLDVETFRDSDGDGIGDFQGLTRSLDYLAGLGVTCLWLLPFYPSPNRDNGYDITDYYNVDLRLGTLGDFVEFIRQAKERGIRIIVDLVINHTSDQHPWFQSARHDRNSKYRNYYVWSEQPQPHDPSLIMFPTEEESLWEYDEAAEAYYLHHFYKEQPDLNIANPVVQEEIRKIIGFWLALGVSGFRIDAASFVIEEIGIPEEHHDELQSFFVELREFVTSRQGDAVLLAEANVIPEQISSYVGNGDRMHLLFNFWLNQHLFLALARKEASPLIDGLKTLPKTPGLFQWLNFIRHHDELSLDKLSETQRQEIFQVFAPQEEMQIFGRGIRRRLPPMLNNDRRWIELVYSLLFTLPGTPLLRYGDEIGMGDDLSLSGRTSVRTPMQWTDSANGGFSTASTDQLTRPMIDSGEYGYDRVNVTEQQRDPLSLINWIERVVWMRKRCPEFGLGEWQILDTDEPCVFAHACEWEGKTVMALHNLSEQACQTTLQFNTDCNLMDLFGNRPYERLAADARSIPLDSYGYRWFRVGDNP